ncbi:transcriptional regulator [Pseudomonas sp. NPDC087346]|uniref:winged helix-turn-helix domain-containing protein n=1 Tax=Pseudomonas sp. NPDC087346 TaxID=3364438 RepID=UPI0038307D95
MYFVFKLKEEKVATFNADDSTLSITSSDKVVESLTLGRSEARLLFFLLKASGETKARTEIIEYVWDDRIVASGSLNQAIFSLRTILDDNSDHEILITVPRRGYRFNQNRVIRDHDLLPGKTEESLIQESPAVNSPPLRCSVQKKMRAVLLAFNKTGHRKKLTMGYLALVPLLLLTLTYIATVEKSKMQIAHSQVNDITLHFLAATFEKAQKFKTAATPELEKLPETLKGEAWLLQTKNGYSISCMRFDRSTFNVSFASQKVTVGGGVKTCLEAAQ